ncbi:MAG: transglycosylase domain-containing protein [Bacteroidales bacterium]|nr:transglycosylase domain-containing protein [Bacteroidales bacterium]
MVLSEKLQKNIFRVLWAGFLIPVIFAVVMFTLIATEKIGYIPSFEELENPSSNLASEIISSDGVLLGKYYKENRTVIEFQDVSPNVVNALLATEDVRFYDHVGIDLQALMRVFKGLVTSNSASGGGSTISQQLAKNLYNMRDHDRPKGLIGKITMKLQEWVTAIRLERRYTKDEIMVMYLNTVGFGHNAFGIQSASKIFFGKNPNDLKLEEASVLVGLLKAPTKYSPKSNPKNSLRRRNTVLYQIEKYQKDLNKLNGFEMKTHEQFDSLRNTELVINYSQQTHIEGIATYFRETLRTMMTAKEPKRENYSKWQLETFKEDSTNWADNPLYGWCNKNQKPDGTPYNIYNDGLKIFVTIDSRMQKYAEQSVAEHMGLGYKDINGTKNDAVQTNFNKYELPRLKNPPYSWRLNNNQVKQIINTSVKRTERWREGIKAGLDSAEIMKQFNTPTKMKVFSWAGIKDTTMSPLDSIKYFQSFIRCGMMSMEPNTGYVKAYVGGINYQYFKYDQVSLGRRQVGSTFKPFVYTMAIMHGISPCHKVANVPYTFDMPAGVNPPTYTPRFSQSSKDGEMITLKTGLALSLNQISAWALKQTSPEEVINLVRNLGITAPIDPVYSICVGAAEIKVKEMVAAYCGFANKGMYTSPIFVTRIEDKNGNQISEFKPRHREALDEITAYKMVEMLRGVVQGGTAGRLRRSFGLTNDIGGKTGTTNNCADGWFMGITPQLVTGVWAGGEERSVQFTNGELGQGSRMALPAWGLYMKKVYDDPELSKIYSKDAKFEAPAGYNSNTACGEDVGNNDTFNVDINDSYSDSLEEY